jgi:glycosyltransferase involved in cell wall biosynthesis
MKNPEISVVIPCLNEEKNLPKLYQKIDKDLTGRCDFEIVLIDDCSTDNTFKLAKELSNQYKSSFKSVLLQRSPPKRGYGSVVRFGIAHANGKFCIPVSADVVDPIELIPQFYDILKSEEFGVVQCNRYSDKKHYKNLPIKNKFYHFFYRRLVKFLINRDLQDPTYSFKMFNRIDVLSMGISSNKFCISPEISFKFSLTGKKTYHYGSSQGEREFGVSKFNFLGEGLGFIHVLIRAILHKQFKILWF